MNYDVFAFGTVLCVSMCVRIVLTYVESADGWNCGRSLDLFCRLVMNRIKFNRCVRVTSTTLSTFP